MRLIESVYLRARYSQGEIAEDESMRVQGAWRRLRGHLTRLIFARPPRATAERTP